MKELERKEANVDKVISDHRQAQLRISELSNLLEASKDLVQKSTLQVDELRQVEQEKKDQIMRLEQELQHANYERYRLKAMI